MYMIICVHKAFYAACYALEAKIQFKACIHACHYTVPGQLCAETHQTRIHVREYIRICIPVHLDRDNLVHDHTCKPKGKCVGIHEVQHLIWYHHALNRCKVCRLCSHVCVRTWVFDVPGKSQVENVFQVATLIPVYMLRGTTCDTITSTLNGASLLIKGKPATQATNAFSVTTNSDALFRYTRGMCQRNSQSQNLAYTCSIPAVVQTCIYTCAYVCVDFRKCTHACMWLSCNSVCMYALFACMHYSIGRYATRQNTYPGWGISKNYFWFLYRTWKVLISSQRAEFVTS